MIDGIIILSIIFLFIGGRAIGTSMTGIADFTTATLTVTSGNVNARSSAGAEPQAAILMFDTSCPSGWTRQTQFDNAIPYGALTYSATPGGSATHTHGVASHTHSTNTIDFATGGSHLHAKGSNAATDGPGNHAHTQPGGSVWPGSGTYGACAGSSTSSDGNHGHTVTFDANTGYTSHDHVLSGSLDYNSDTLDSQTSIPAYARLVFCRKN